MRIRGIKLPGFRRGFGISAALLLATAALAGLSIQSVFREAQVRKRLIADTHRSIADIVTARLDAAMLDADRAAAAELQALEPRTDTMLRKIHELEQSRPWLAPLVIVSGATTNTNPPDSGAERFAETFAAAERAEYRDQATAEATALYAKAAVLANSGRQRAAALNGQARAELKAGDPLRAAGTYKKLIAETETLDAEQARLSLIARDQLVACLENDSAFQDAVLDLYQFLLSHRFILEEDAYDFYRHKADEALARVPAGRLAALRLREEQLNAAAPVLRAALSSEVASHAVVSLMPLGNNEARVAHFWTLSNAITLLKRSLVDPGPWSAVDVAIAEESENSAAAVGATRPLARTPQWRITAFPKAGSVDALASREVLRFAALLILVVGAVVAAMLLAARSVARELALARTRSDFVASVSHELKTPLSLIRMFAESLREGWVDDAKRSDYYEVITRESERLTGLINNVLDFSRIESGTRKYDRTTADLRGILAGLLERYRYHLNAARIDLIEQLPNGPVDACVDAGAIEQVLVNLLSNAVKYMGDSGKRSVRVSLTAGDSHALITIADTGIGMSEEDRIHVFERFWRADDERVRSVAGSGLGLTLVKHVVEAHDGAIAVESAPGRGSTFAVTLPLRSGGTT